MSAAFRFSVFNILALGLASYASVDCVTYFWPYFEHPLDQTRLTPVA